MKTLFFFRIVFKNIGMHTIPLYFHCGACSGVGHLILSLHMWSSRRAQRLKSCLFDGPALGDGTTGVDVAGVSLVDTSCWHTHELAVLLQPHRVLSCKMPPSLNLGSSHVATDKAVTFSSWLNFFTRLFFKLADNFAPMPWVFFTHCPTMKLLSILMRGIAFDPPNFLSPDSSVVAWQKECKNVRHCRVCFILFWS